MPSNPAPSLPSDPTIDDDTDALISLAMELEAALGLYNADRANNANRRKQQDGGR